MKRDDREQQVVPSPRARIRRPGGSPFRRQQLARLLQIVVSLQSNRCPNAGRLADECEVSRRTIFRDLESIEAAGIPIEFDPVRQGYRLGTSTRVAPVGLDDREAVALVLAVNQSVPSADALGYAREARSGLMKLIVGLPDEIRVRLESILPAVEGTVAVDTRPERSREVHDRIIEALELRVEIRIAVREVGGVTTESTRVAPYRLILGRSGWDLIGRSTLHRRVRLFPVARIEEVVVTADAAVIPPRFDAERWLEFTWSGEPGPDREEVRLRFACCLAATIRGGVWHPTQRLESLPDGRLDLLLTLDRPADLTGWILGHGDLVEVISPDGLRRLVGLRAMTIAGLYADDRSSARLGSPEVPTPPSPRSRPVSQADFAGVGG